MKEKTSKRIKKVTETNIKKEKKVRKPRKKIVVKEIIIKSFNDFKKSIVEENFLTKTKLFLSLKEDEITGQNTLQYVKTRKIYKYTYKYLTNIKGSDKMYETSRIFESNSFERIKEKIIKTIELLEERYNKYKKR